MILFPYPSEKAALPAKNIFPTLLFFQNSLRDNLAAIQHLNRQFGGRGSKLEVIRAGAADEVKVSAAGKAEAPPLCDKK